MQEFLNIALSLPTIIWSVGLTLVCVYWVVVIIGALDLDFLDAHLDLDFDADIDVDADLDGVGLEGLGKVAVALGIGKVPLTILATFLSLTGWMISFFGTLYGPDSTLARVLVFAVSVGVAVPVMGALAHPFKRLFTITTRRGGADLIGRTCDITTGSVTETFGQARLSDGGAGLLLAVRCDTPNDLTRRSTALIIGFDEATQIYAVEPYEVFTRTVDHAATELVVEEAQYVDSKQEV